MNQKETQAVLFSLKEQSHNAERNTQQQNFITVLLAMQDFF